MLNRINECKEENITNTPEHKIEVLKQNLNEYSSKLEFFKNSLKEKDEIIDEIGNKINEITDEIPKLNIKLEKLQKTFHIECNSRDDILWDISLVNKEIISLKAVLYDLLIKK